MSGTYSAPPQVVSDVRSNYDRTVVYADGRTRGMRNYYLPIPIDDASKGYLEKTYQFGTALDPYWSAGYSQGTVQIVDDHQSGNDRIASYSDGSSFVSKDWYIRNPSYSSYRVMQQAAPFVQTPPIPRTTSVPADFLEDDGLEPSDVVIPPNISAPAPDTVSTFVLGTDYDPSFGGRSYGGPIADDRQTNDGSRPTPGPAYATGNVVLPTVTVSVPPMPKIDPIVLILIAVALYYVA